MIARILSILTVLGLCVNAGMAFASVSEEVKDAHVRARLISDVSAISPGSEFWVAVRLTMDKGWHTYWINPGDSGLATSVEWDLPEGIRAGPLLWPIPGRIDLPPLTSYGYEGEVWLLTRFHLSERVKSPDTLSVGGTVKWLACKVKCIPGKARLFVSLPVKNAPDLDDQWTQAFARARSLLPVTQDDWSVEATRSGEAITVSIVSPPWFDREITSLEFFAEHPELLNHAAAQHFRRVSAGRYLLTLTLAANAPDLRELRGVLVCAQGWRGAGSEQGLAIGVPLRSGLSAVEHDTAVRWIWLYLAFAFIGGMILNLMPCVLPVLSLKVLGFVKQGGTNVRHARVHSLLYSAGIIVSFWIMALALMLIRAGGQHAGWGYQLQSPGFVIFLTALFFVLALSLFGIFEIGTSFTSLAVRTRQSSGPASSFLSGVLAAVVATPCTAPFMGPALGFALAQPPGISLAVFTALGAGMAGPYVLLSWIPAVYRFVPKPGAWLETFQQAMAFLLMATVVWLLWVLGVQTGSDGVMITVAGLWLIGAGAWILGRWTAPVRSPAARACARLVAAGFAAAGLLLPVQFVRTMAGPRSGKYEPGEPNRSEWIPYSKSILNKLRAEGRPVFLDFTAAWCLTCRVNEHIALETSEVMQKFKELNVALIKADWTSRDENINKALAEYGRTSIPLYVLYGRDPAKPPKILPEILTPGIVLKALEQLED